MPKSEIIIVQPPNIHRYLMSQMVGYHHKKPHLALSLFFFLLAIILIIVAVII